jgi:hypothetical protein
MTLYLVLTMLPLILLIFWLVRVRLTKASKKYLMPYREDIPSLHSPAD